MGLGEKKEIIARYVSQGLNSRRAIEIMGITRHQYYYKPKPGKQGCKPSSKTPKVTNGTTELVSNQDVLDEVRKLKEDPDLNSGYHSATYFLKSKGYIINDKKTYRLMKEADLIGEKTKSVNKTYAKYRKVLPKNPLEVLEMDIKMAWIERERRHAFILNVIDTFSRKWLHQSTGFSITKDHVKAVWEQIIYNYLQPNDSLKKGIHIEIRNDNDPRFSANIIQEFFKENKLNQVFTHPYTPQENAHVESFHNTLAKHLNLQCFWTINQLDQNLILFMEKYNNIRQHTKIAYLAPNDFGSLWSQNLIHAQFDQNKKTTKFQLKIPRYEVQQYTGNDEPEGSPLSRFEPLNGAINRTDKEMCGATTS